MADPGYIVDGVLTDGEGWVAVASTTLDADTASITFTSTDDGQVGDFSQYMDLVAICYLRGAQTGAGYEFLWVYCNGDSTAGNYEAQHFVSDGATDTAAADNPLVVAYTVKSVTSPSTISADIFGGAICHFFDVNSGKYKSSVSQGASDIDGAGYVDMHVRTWKSQAAITSLLFRMENGDLSDESRIDLFGILPRMVA